MAGVREIIARRLWGERLRERVAWLSPMPPAPTGIATYSRAVLDGLERTGFRERQRIEAIWPASRRFEGALPWYALCVYHLGNNVEFHRDIYRDAIRVPGLVVLHDLALDDFVKGMVARGDPVGRRSLREAIRNVDRIRSEDLVRSEPLRVPWAAHVARRARGIVVHSEFGRRYLRELGSKTPVFVVPHPVVEREGDVRRARARRTSLRQPLEARGMRTLVGVFGDLNPAKLLDVVAEAVRTLPAMVHLVLVGRRIEGYDVDAVVRESALGERVTLLPDVSDGDFLGWMCAADVMMDLRHPHRGEVSGSLARAMQCGTPAIVSGIGSYLDLPEDLVVRVSSGRPDPSEVAAAIDRLAGDPALAAGIGDRARAHVEQQAREDATARGYAAAIERTLALVRDPAHLALARWARSLVDLSVTGEHVARGYGLSYARALEELTPREGGP
ncbi:MAG: glycosyltransferase family 4 protein [Actinobacteria bacterium]|nr:MAG: glycosyltransferase family 4 protein [Actinomycetota bacterium]